MKKLLMVLAFTVAAFGTVCFGAKRVTASGEATTEKRNLSGFSSISASAGIVVHFTQSGEYGVSVKADKNILPYVRTEVSKGTLIVGYEKGTSINTKGIKTEVYVAAPTVNQLNASSSADINVAGSLKVGNLSVKASSSGDVKLGVVTCNNFEASASSSGDIEATNLQCKKADLSASSSGDIEMNIKADNCKAAASSSGDITLSGSCTSINASASSSGDIECSKLIAKEATAKASSGSELEIYSTNSLDFNSTSGATITSYGNPKKVSGNTSSGGSLKKR